MYLCLVLSVKGKDSLVVWSSALGCIAVLVISYCTFGVSAVRVVCVSVHVCVCFIHAHDMFVQIQGIYMCMSHVYLSILQYIILYI